MRTTVRLSAELLERAKRKAAADGKTLTSLIEEGLRSVIAEKPAGSVQSRRVKLPVSTAKGGLLPGIDPVKINTDSEEAEDVERLQRIARQR